MRTSEHSVHVRIQGIPYAQSKARGKVAGPQQWSDAVVSQTAHLARVTGPCSLDVTFRLPPDKFPADHPFGMDLDNLLKRLLDALQKTVFRDAPGGDGCIVELCARKTKVETYSLAGADLSILPIER